MPRHRQDLGKVYSTPTLAYQARFENARRWLTFDLLAGRVDGRHALRRFLTRKCAVDPDELDWFVDNPLPPDIIGVNHYLTSERFLDDRLRFYPRKLHGGNRRHSYADVEAVRVLPNGLAGPERLLEETWERYGLPIAVTEVHLGCTREQQMRWLVEVWDAACRLRERGVDIRAVTAWSLLGAFDWNSLLTENRGHYEPGIFDLRGGSPRPTALASVVMAIARDEELPHLTRGPRWWREPERLTYPAPEAHAGLIHRDLPATERVDTIERPLVICGARGRIGRAFVRICRERGLATVALGREQLDITDREQVESMLIRYRPWAVVNAAGYVRVDDAEQEAERCLRENTWGAAILAGACARAAVPMLGFSTDLVFNGETSSPYRESDQVDPLNVYGRSKAESEYVILNEHSAGLVVRTGAVLDPWNGYCFMADLLRQLRNGGRITVAEDLTISPTYLPDLINGALDLLIDGASGIWHLANRGVMTWAELARAAVTLAGFDPSGVIPIPTSDLGLRARRPSYSALDSERGAILPSVEDALDRYVTLRLELAGADSDDRSAEENGAEMEIEVLATEG